MRGGGPCIKLVDDYVAMQKSVKDGELGVRGALLGIGGTSTA